MKDDDLDLDLDLGPDVPAVPERASKPVSSGAQADRKAPEPAAKPTKPAKMLPERRPGAFSRLGSQVSGQLSHLGPPAWNWRNFGLGLVVLLVLLLLGTNWAPVRIYVLGLRLELPGAIAFLLSVVLGGALTWLCLRRHSAPRGQ